VVRAIGSKPELYRVVLRAFACVHRVLRRVLRVLPLPRLSLGQFVRSGNTRGLRPHQKQLAKGKLVDANLVTGEQEALNQIRSIKSFLQKALGKNGDQKSVDVSKMW
jgi:hypothetical protein